MDILSVASEAPKAAPARPRLIWISVLNVVACVCVVILHCSNGFFDGPGSEYYFPTAFVHATFYWPVPVFLMISGATLMNYRERMSTREYLERRWRRVGIPFLFWSVVAVIYWYLVAWYMGENWQVFDPIKIIVSIGRGDVNIYYWFFPALFSAYLLIIMLSAIEKPLRVRVLAFVAALGIVYQLLNVSVLPLLGYSSESDWAMPVAGLMLYPVLGYLCVTIDFTRRQRIAIYAIGIAGWLVHLWSLWVLSVDLGRITGVLSSYDNITAITQAVAVFVAFRYIPWERLCGKFPSFAPRIDWLSSCSFGIYLVQYYVMDRIGEYLPGFFVGWRLILFGFIPAYLLSLLVVAIIKKIPVLRNVV